MTQRKQRIRSIVILIVLIAAALIATLFLHTGKQGNYALVTVDGAVYQTLPLYVDTEVNVKTKEGYNIICVKDGQVYVREADCSNQVCVNTGAISGKGEVIACLPHGLTVTVEAADEEVDTVAY